MRVAAEALTKPFAAPDAVASRVEKRAAYPIIRYLGIVIRRDGYTYCGEKGYLPIYMSTISYCAHGVASPRGRSQRGDGLSSVHTSRGRARSTLSRKAETSYTIERVTH